VQRLAIFGSARRDDFDPETSDVDFLVDLGPGPFEGRANVYFGLLRSLTELFGREVDLVEVGAVKNPYIKRRIDSEQELLYAA